MQVITDLEIIIAVAHSLLETTEVVFRMIIYGDEKLE
jgi:hypothetical protein